MTKAERMVRNHPLVEEISDERSMDSGIWAYLVPGHIREVGDPVHNVHEDTWPEVLRALNNVALCYCGQCVKKSVRS